MAQIVDQPGSQIPAILPVLMFSHVPPHWSEVVRRTWWRQRLVAVVLTVPVAVFVVLAMVLILAGPGVGALAGDSVSPARAVVLLRLRRPSRYQSSWPPNLNSRGPMSVSGRCQALVPAVPLPGVVPVP